MEIPGANVIHRRMPAHPRPGTAQPCHHVLSACHPQACSSSSLCVGRTPLQAMQQPPVCPVLVSPCYCFRDPDSLHLSFSDHGHTRLASGMLSLPSLPLSSTSMSQDTSDHISFPVASQTTMAHKTLHTAAPPAALLVFPLSMSSKPAPVCT